MEPWLFPGLFVSQSYCLVRKSLKLISHSLRMSSDTLSEGTRVRIISYEKRPEYNGKEAYGSFSFVSLIGIEPGRVSYHSFHDSWGLLKGS